MVQRGGGERERTARERAYVSGERGACRRKRRGRELSQKRERQATPSREDCRPMRHQAGDDVAVVSRRSLTKSLLRVPVRPRSPGWTTRWSSSRYAYRIVRIVVIVVAPFFFFFFFPSSLLWFPPSEK